MVPPLLLVTLLLALTPPTSGDNDYDLIVYGSSPAGIAAAVAAGQLGLAVALYEPLPMIGGMGAAGNLALNDGGMNAERTGLAKKFSLMNGKHYYNGTTTTSQSREVPHPESFVANATFYEMLEEANVKEIHLDCRLLAVNTTTGTVRSVTVSCLPNSVTAVVFIDASYDGDLMVQTGVIDYTSGRESVAQYNESLAGARAPGWSGVAGPHGVSPFQSHNNVTLLKYVDNLTTLAAPGSADDRLMAFQHRMCISGEENRVPWPKPSNYNPDDFQLLQKTIGKRNIRRHCLIVLNPVD
mgnify:CR=1 FL=1